MPRNQHDKSESTVSSSSIPARSSHSPRAPPGRPNQILWPQRYYSRSSRHQPAEASLVHTTLPVHVAIYTPLPGAPSVVITLLLVGWLAVVWALKRLSDRCEGMRIRCDACEGAAATVVCCADEAALCARCDVQIHGANKLASKHQRLPLDDGGGAAAASRLARCDICQEKAAFVFCVEDRALFCRDCDESIHVQGTLSGNHQRYLATGIRVGFSSVCGAHADNSLPPKGSGSKPLPPSAVSAGEVPRPASAPAAAQEVPSSPFLPPSCWAVEDLLQFSDYESSDKKGSPPPLGFKELEWFADIDLFHHDEAPVKVGGTAAEVPELFAAPQPVSNAVFYKTSAARQSKKARVELPDEEDYLIVPDLG